MTTNISNLSRPLREVAAGWLFTQGLA